MDEDTPQIVVADFSKMREDRRLMRDAFGAAQFETALESFHKVARERQEKLDICKMSKDTPESFFKLHHDENIQDYIIGASSAFKVGTDTRTLSYFHHAVDYSRFVLLHMNPLDSAIVYKNIVFEYAMSQTILFKDDNSYKIDFEGYLDIILENSQDPLDFMKCTYIYTGLQDYPKVLTLDQKLRKMLPSVNAARAGELHQKQAFMASIAESFFPEFMEKLRQERIKAKSIPILQEADSTSQIMKIAQLRLSAISLFQTRDYLHAFQKFQELHMARTFYITHHTLPESLRANFLDQAYEELINAYTCALNIDHHVFIQTTARQTLENQNLTPEQKKPLLHRFAVSALITGDTVQALEYMTKILENPSLYDLIVCDYLYIGLGQNYNGHIQNIEMSIKDTIRKFKIDQIIPTIKETNFFKEIIIGRFKENNHKTSNTFKMVSSFYIFLKSLKMDQKPLNIDKIWEMALKRQNAYVFSQNGDYEKVIELLNQTLPILKGIKRHILSREEDIDDFLEKLHLLVEMDEHILKNAIENYTPPEWSDEEESTKDRSSKKKKKKKKKAAIIPHTQSEKAQDPKITEEDEDPQIPLKSLETLPIIDDALPVKSLETLSIINDALPGKKKGPIFKKNRKTAEERLQAKAQREAANMPVQEPAVILQESDILSSDDEDDGIIFITTPSHSLTKAQFDEHSARALELFFAQEYDESAALFNHIMDASLPYDAYSSRSGLKPHYAIANLYSKNKERFFLQEKFFSRKENITLAAIFERISLNYLDKDDYYIWKECLFMAGRAYVNAAQASILGYHKVSNYLAASRFFSIIQDIPNTSKAYFCAAEEIDISLVKDPFEVTQKTQMRRDLYLSAQTGFDSYQDTILLEKVNAILKIEFSPSPVAGFLEKNNIRAAKKRRFTPNDFELVQQKIDEDHSRKMENFRKRMREEDEKERADEH